MSQDKRKIGLLGLSADPPHNGHLEIAQLLLDKGLVDNIWLIPCFEHSFDKLLSRPEHRWQMALLLEDKRIQVSNVEFRHKGKSYTIDTVMTLKKEYPCREFFWIVGSDIIQGKSYERWKDWVELSSLVKFLVVPRVGFKIKEVLPPGFKLVEGKISNISSTKIRGKVRRRLSIQGLVPQKVEEHIKKHNLYR